MFQYSFCSYSTAQLIQNHNSQVEFQYSFCSYSTYSEYYEGEFTDCFNTASVLIQLFLHAVPLEFPCVSIQLLFLFNKYRRATSQKLFSVSIQLLFLFNMDAGPDKLASLTFQYSFCSYSTINFTAIIIYRIY